MFVLDVALVAIPSRQGEMAIGKQDVDTRSVGHICSRNVAVVRRHSFSTHVCDGHAVFTLMEYLHGEDHWK